MFEITIKTFNDVTKSIYVVSHNTMIFYLNQFIKCEDCEQVTIIDGLTGELLWDWYQGKFTVIDGTII